MHIIAASNAIHVSRLWTLHWRPRHFDIVVAIVSPSAWPLHLLTMVSPIYCLCRLLCFETKLRLSADNTGSVRIDDCKAMVIGGAEESSGYSESAAAMMKPGGSSRVPTQQATSGSGRGWMKSLFATPMIETFLTSIVSAFSSAKPSNSTINGQ